jgi:hypothetical protein
VNFTKKGAKVAKYFKRDLSTFKGHIIFVNIAEFSKFQLRASSLNKILTKISVQSSQMGSSYCFIIEVCDPMKYYS